MKLLLALSLALALQQSGAPKDTYTLTPARKLLEEVSFKTSSEFEVAGQMMKHTSKYVEKPLEVKENGDFVVEVREVESKMTFEGQENTLEKEEPYKVFYGSRGNFLKKEGGDKAESDELRLMRLSSMVAPEKPVHVGDSWTYEEAADNDLKVPKFQIKFTLEAEEINLGRKVLRVKAVATETEGEKPAKIDAILTIDAAQGYIYRAEGKLKDVPMNEDEQLNGTFTVEQDISAS